MIILEDALKFKEFIHTYYDEKMQNPEKMQAELINMKVSVDSRKDRK